VVVYRQGQAEVYGVFHHISLSQSRLGYTFEALQGLFAVAFLFVHLCFSFIDVIEQKLYLCYNILDTLCGELT
jgi:hypothetical protein